jgi:hypothetical protein
MVAAFDVRTGESTVAPIASTQRHTYHGDMISVTAGGSTVVGTGNHPFFVLQGRDLQARPRPADVPPDDQISFPAGRWVAARDLVVGDLLVVTDGSTARVSSVRPSQRTLPVYNLTVGGLNTYCVGDLGAVVHNKGGVGEFPEEFRADHPFLYLIRDEPTGAILFMGRVVDPSR